MTPNETPTPVPSNSVQLRRMGILVCLAISAGTGLAWSLEQSGVHSFHGVLEARTTVVKTDRPIRVHEVSIKTGQSVVPGDPLFQLIDGQLEDQLVSKRREIAEFEAELARSKGVAEVELAWRRRELQAETFETQLKVAGLAQEKLNKQVEQIAWKERLTSNETNIGPLLAEVDHPFRSISIDLRAPDDRRLQAMLREDAAAASAESLATQIALCEQRLKQLELFEKEIEKKVMASSGVDLAEARIQGAKQELASLESHAKELTVTSPAYGMVSDASLQSGDRVPSNGTLVEILDNTQPRIVARIPSGTASKLHHGSKVTLVFPMNQRRIGIIASIPPQTTPPDGSSETFVAVKVEPAGKLWPKLAIGSSVRVCLEDF